MGITFKSVRQNNIVELIFWRSSIFNSIFESLRLYFIKKRKIVFQYLDVNFWFLNSEYRTRIFGRHLPLIDVLFFL